MPESQDLKAYYNDHNIRVLIHDYVYGNRRFEMAINRIVDSVPCSIRRILDIGCGIGYSSWLMKKAFPKARILGIDISDESIAAARGLFQFNGIHFERTDLLSFRPDSIFDLIVMIDVYEHIPKNLRESIHEKLRNLIADNGWLIVTTPTVEHQAYLRELHPERLQIIDEDVSIYNLIELAEALRMEVLFLDRVAVWHRYDYQHLVACRHNTFTSVSSYSSVTFSRRVLNRLRRIFLMDLRQIRRRKVKKTLGFDPLD